MAKDNFEKAYGKSIGDIPTRSDIVALMMVLRKEDNEAS